MIAYLDLSALVFVFTCIISMFFSMILADNIIYTRKFKINHFFWNIISYLINLFFIPYFYFIFYIFYLIIYLFVNPKYIKMQLYYLFFYLTSIAFLLLVGGSFIYEGILLINVPYACLFALIMPFLILLLSIFTKVVFRRLKRNKFICKCRLKTQNGTYELKGFYDTGNNLMCNNLPVIFVNLPIKIENIPFKLIIVKTINHEDSFNKAYEGILLINKKKIHCYFIVSDQVNFIYNTNSLLNNQIKI